MSRDEPSCPRATGNHSRRLMQSYPNEERGRINLSDNVGAPVTYSIVCGKVMWIAEIRRGTRCQRARSFSRELIVEWVDSTAREWLAERETANDQQG